MTESETAEAVRVGSRSGRPHDGDRQTARRSGTSAPPSPTKAAATRPDREVAPVKVPGGAGPTESDPAPAPEPSEVAVLMQDPMTRARLLSQLSDGTSRLRGYPGGDEYLDWVLQQYSGAGNLTVGPSPRSAKAYPVNDSETMAGIVGDEVDAGTYDLDYEQQYREALRSTPVDDLSRRGKDANGQARKPYSATAKAWQTDHGVELQHLPGGDHAGNYRMVHHGLHAMKSSAANRVTARHREVAPDDSDGDQHDHLAEVDLSDPNVGYWSETFGWGDDEWYADDDQE